jgi:1D-myo-inositol 3-kinase
MTGSRGREEGTRRRGEREQGIGSMIAEDQHQVSSIKHRVSRIQNQASSIQFLAIGHFAHDVTENGLILGGAAAYSSLAAKRLGLRVGMVSAVGRDFLHYEKLDGISLALTGDPADNETTTFQNIYEDGVRRQMIRGVSAPIRPEHIPTEWLNTEIVYLCPVANEVDKSIVHRFPNSLIGVSPQGWMRQWDDQGRVSARKWRDAPDVLPYVDVVVMSEEDIAPFPEIVREYADLTKIVILTRGDKGSMLLHDGKTVNFPAFSVPTTDPTGAGDVFALAFLREFYRTGNLCKASIFANCTASFVVEKQGTEGIPDLEQVLSRLSRSNDLTQPTDENCIGQVS